MILRFFSKKKNNARREIDVNHKLSGLTLYRDSLNQPLPAQRASQPMWVEMWGHGKHRREGNCGVIASTKKRLEQSNSFPRALVSVELSVSAKRFISFILFMLYMFLSIWLPVAKTLLKHLAALMLSEMTLDACGCSSCSFRQHHSGYSL